MDPKLRFDKFMELALYHPQHGYYSSSIGKKIGRSGDFFTSVSVGDTFGLLLSHAIEKKWEIICPENDKPLVLVEQGAHDGQLARDILDGLHTRNSPLNEKVEYRIVEPRESIRRELCEILDGTRFDGRLSLVSSLTEAHAASGIFICNELLDAFPVRRFIWEGGRWRDLAVKAEEKGGQLIEATMEIAPDDEEFDRFLSLVGESREFQDGYVTEFCPAMKGWVKECSQLFEDSGAWMFIDYGFEADEYFNDARTTGTLKCYDQHRTHDDPLYLPGESDITAHVNFTDLIREGEKAGFEFCGLTDQSKFLTEAGKTWILGLDGEIPTAENAARLRQFQTLTHPAMMGRSFRVAEFEKGI